MEFTDTRVKEKIYVGVEGGKKVFALTTKIIAEAKEFTNKMKISHPGIRLYRAEVIEFTHIEVNKEIPL